MVQEFVLCHEVCHLKYEEWDEAETNRLAARLFLDRAASEKSGFAQTEDSASVSKVVL